MGFVGIRSMESSSEEALLLQNLFMMRHGERMDNYDPHWILPGILHWLIIWQITDLGDGQKVENREVEYNQGYMFPVLALYSDYGWGRCGSLRCGGSPLGYFLQRRRHDPSKVKVRKFKWSSFCFSLQWLI